MSTRVLRKPLSDKTINTPKENSPSPKKSNLKRKSTIKRKSIKKKQNSEDEDESQSDSYNETKIVKMPKRENKTSTKRKPSLSILGSHAKV